MSERAAASGIGAAAEAGGTKTLAARDLSVGYLGHAAIRNVEIDVGAGEVVALVGPNGAGKTTLLRALAGDLSPIAGTVEWEGAPVDAPLHLRAREGVAFVTEERSVFMQLSVADNIRLGRCDPDHVTALFPELSLLMQRRAGLLSGGEQQMLTLGRALARKPKLLLADELSLGLAPLVVKRMLQAIRDAADRDGLGAIIVEQQVHHALEIADRAYVLRRGEVVLQGSAATVSERMDDLVELYL